MAYFEGEIPTVVSGNGYNNGGMFGNDGWWGIILIALLFGWGRGGYGGFGGNGGSGSEFLGYELGKVATTNDIASGFNNSAVLGNLNSIKENQLAMQNFINQGFSGLSSQLIGEFRNVDNAICTLGYQNQAGFNSLAHQISDCCCATRQAISDVKYANERNTYEIINAINTGNQRLVDIYTNDKIDTLNRKLATAEAQLSNNAQSRYITDTILDKLSPCPKPAYLTCNPATGLVYPNTGNNGCCGF